MVLEYKHNGVEAVHLDNVNELIRYATDPDYYPNPKNEGDRKLFAKDYLDSDREVSPNGWLNESVSAVKAGLTEGWAEGLAQIQKNKRALKLPKLEIKDRRRKRCRNSTRGNVDIDRFNKGQPHGLFIRRERQVVNTSPIISLVCSIGGLGHRTNKELFWSGAAAIILTERLEAADYRVEIFAGDHSANGGGRTSTSLKLKGPDEQMRASILAAVLARGATFRSLFVPCRFKAAKSFSVDWGYGTTDDVTHSNMHVNNPVWRKNALVIPQLYKQQTCEEFLIKTIKQFDMELTR